MILLLTFVSIMLLLGVGLFWMGSKKDVPGSLRYVGGLLVFICLITYGHILL